MTGQPVTEQRLAELEALERAATPGEWRRGSPSFNCRLKHHHGAAYGRNCVYTFITWHDYPPHAIYRDGDYPTSKDDPGPVCGPDGCDGGGVTRAEDADFIVALRNAAPDLFAEVRRLRAGLAAALPSVEHHLYCCDEDSEHHRRVAPILARCRAALGLEPTS